MSRIPPLEGSSSVDLNQGLRWPGWEQATRELGADRGFSVYPFLWARLEPGQERSRRPVPMEELWHLHSQGLPGTGGGQ